MSPANKATGAGRTFHHLLLGDARQVLRQLPADTVDLIITSPPYADARATSYGGPAPEAYVAWFLPIGEELRRVLKPSGTFILNLKEGCRKGERSTYVLELVLALKAQGWLWTEEFIWHKKHCYPGKWPNRFRDAWERLLQFNRQWDFAMYQDAVKVPAKASTLARGVAGSPRDHLQVVSGSGSGLSRRVASCTRSTASKGSSFGERPTGFTAGRPSTPTTCCTWRWRRRTNAIRLLSPRPCPIGSSGCSPSPATWYSTRSWAAAP